MSGAVEKNFKMPAVKILDAVTGLEVVRDTRLLSPYDVAFDFDHHKIHLGKMFTITKVFTNVDTTSVYFTLKTNVNYKFHGKLFVASDVGALVEIFHTPTINAAGTTPANAFNNDLSSANTLNATHFTDETYTADGTKIYEESIGNSYGIKNRTFDRSSEIVFDKNKIYLVKVTTLADNGNVSVALQGYEE